MEKIKLMKKEVIARNKWTNYEMTYHIIISDDKKYIMIQDNRDVKQDEVSFIFNNKIELTERYKDLKDQNNNESFVHQIDLDQELRKRAKYYVSYHDFDVKYPQRNFALIKLTKEDLPKFLKYLI